MMNELQKRRVTLSGKSHLAGHLLVFIVSSASSSAAPVECLEHVRARTDSQSSSSRLIRSGCVSEQCSCVPLVKSATSSNSSAL
jgi:hypothetical protein